MTGQQIRSSRQERWLLTSASGLFVLVLVLMPTNSLGGEPGGGRPAFQIGYTAHRTNLPGGQFANRSTSRAYMVQGDGTGVKQLAPELTSKPNQSTQLDGWSPDGRQAVILKCWESAENGKWEHDHKDFRFSAEHWLVDIVLFDIQRREIANLTSVERVSFYNHGLHFWPKDPKLLSFVALIDGQLRPFSMDRDGKNKKALSEGAGFIYCLNNSPDGKRICYHKDYQAICLADADGRNVRRVADGNPFQFAPTWSPDGKWIAYLSGEHYKCHVYLTHADGTDVRKVGDRGDYRGVFETLDEPDFHSARSDIPTWSPDGKWLYYTAKVGKSVELMRVSPNGKPEQLTRSMPDVVNYLPQISPDSKWVVFGSTQTGLRQLHVAHADGSGAYQLTKVEAGWGAFLPHWRPR